MISLVRLTDGNKVQAVNTDHVLTITQDEDKDECTVDMTAGPSIRCHGKLADLAQRFNRTEVPTGEPSSQGSAA